MVDEMVVSKVELDGETLSIDDVLAVARYNATVTISDAAKVKVETAAKLVDHWVDADKVIYGLTTGFGPLSEIVIPTQKARELQRNLIISHAAGVGAPLPTEIVRAAMLLRANTLAKGFSGIRQSTLDLLVAFLNQRIHPIIPSQGSVGASGDLAPLSHMALVLIGEGEAEYQGKILPGAKALELASLKPITLEHKEGIALINGTQIMTAIAALAVVDAQNLIVSAEIIAALSIEALEGVSDPFDRRIHEVRPHQGQRSTAQNLLKLLKGSNLVISSKKRSQRANQAIQKFQKVDLETEGYEKAVKHILLHHAAETILAINNQLAIEPDNTDLLKRREAIHETMKQFGISKDLLTAALQLAQHTQRVQDAYSIRCIPQVLGAVRDAIDFVATTVTTEINSATDNPLIFPKSKTFLSGGNFHGQPIATAMDFLTTAVTSIGTIAERRMARLIDHHLSSGLPLLLLQPKEAEHGVHYGLGLTQIVAAALLAECQALSTPASIATIPTSANQEDHVSMGTIAARQAREVINNVETIVALELLCATQGVNFRKLYKPVKLGLGTEIAYSASREAVPRLTTDKGIQRDRLTQDVFIHQDIMTLKELIHTQRLSQHVQNKVKGL